MLTNTNPKNRVLGIDPGYDRLGFAVLENGDGNSKQKPNVIVSGCIITDRKDLHHNRLLHIGKELEKIISEYKPNICAIESLFFSTNQKTATKVSESRGVIIFSLAKVGVECYEFTPMTVKLAVTGYGKSDKSQVTMMVERLVNFNQNKKSKMLDDEYDAIAIALTGLISYPQQQMRKVLLQK